MSSTLRSRRTSRAVPRGTCGSGRGTAARSGARAASPRRRRGPRCPSGGRERCHTRFTSRPASTFDRNGSGQPPGRSPSSPAMNDTTESGTSYFSGLRSKSSRVGLHRGQVQGEVAHDLRRGGDLGDATEDPVRRGVHVLDELEVVGEAERVACCRRFESCRPGSRGGTATGGTGKTRLERTVQVAHRLPVRLEVGNRGEIEPGVALGVRERGHQSRQRRLTGGARHGRGRGVHGIRPRRRGGQQVASWPPAVSCVWTWTGTSNRSRRAVTRRAAAARDAGAPPCPMTAEDVSPASTICSGQTQVVFERVESSPGRAGRRLADGDLGDRGSGGQDRVDRGAHLRDVVERVEDPEDVDPRMPRPRRRTRRLPPSGTGCSRRCCVRASILMATFGRPDGARRDAPRGSSPRNRRATS